MDRQHDRWQLSGGEAEAYERYKVPRLFQPLALRLLEHVPLARGQRVLDVACGTGIVARLAASRVAPAGEVIGVDLNEGMLAVARAHTAEDGVAIEWRQCDAAALPYADASFDAVLCQQGLQFFPDKPRALKEMRRVLVPGGIVALGVFGLPSAYNVALSGALARHVGKQVAQRSLAPFALADADALRAVVAEAGLKKIKLNTIVFMQRVEPTQEWLLQDSAGLPYASALAGLDLPARATFMREIAAKLKDCWDRDCFMVPTQMHVVRGWK